MIAATVSWPWVNLVALHPTLGRYLALCCYSPWVRPDTHTHTLTHSLICLNTNLTSQELFFDYLLVLCAARLDFTGFAAGEQLARLNAVLGDVPNKDGSSWCVWRFVHIT